MFKKGKRKEAEPGSSSSTPTRLFELEDRAAFGETQITTSPKRLARIAGVLYLLAGIFGGFAEGYVEPKIGDRLGSNVGRYLVISESAKMRW